MSARSVLAMATAGSAAGLGRTELGHLREGSAADLCVWDVSGVADAGVADQAVLLLVRPLVVDLLGGTGMPLEDARALLPHL